LTAAGVKKSEFVKNAVFNSLTLMNQILTRREEILNEAVSISSPMKANKAYEDLSGLVVLTKQQNQTITLKQLQDLLATLHRKFDNFDQTTELLHAKYGKPGPVSLYWPHFIALSCGLWGLFSFVQSAVLSKWFNNTKDAVRGFVVDWIIQPIIQIYETVRHKEGRLGIMGSAALSADIQSLERMVVDFAKDQGVSDGDLDVLVENVKRGDISAVMKQYEIDLRSPIRSAFSGDLIRALLIQVHKTKVDGELAMSALDKLLKSNELNFAFFAVVPSAAILYLTTSRIHSALSSRNFYTLSLLTENVESSLWKISRILNRCTSRELSYMDEGQMLVQFHLLRMYAEGVRDGSRRERFLEDLRELEEGDLNVEQRFRVVGRLYRWNCKIPL